MSGPTVSVVIPTYFRNAELREVLDSVAAQAYEPLEVIVVDDSGEGHAEPVIEEYEDVTYVPLEENQGPNVARDCGVERATGEYVQLLDDDDHLLSGKIAKQVSVAEAGPEVGVVYCGIRWPDGSVVLPCPEVRGSVLGEALAFQTAPCITSTMLVDREALEEIRPLTNRYGGADDTGMKIALARHTEFDFVDEPLVERGRSENSYGNSWSTIEGRERILEDYADLYEQFPESVRQTARSETYMLEGNFYLGESIWSPNAITSYAKAMYHRPRLDLVYVGTFLASLFGRPGHNAARKAYKQLSRRPTQRGKAT